VPSIREALDECKTKGYWEKLKTTITPDSMPSDHEDLVEFLCKQAVIHTDGMFFIYS